MKHPVIYYVVLGILVFIIGMMLGILTGCASHHTLTPAQIATTRPITHPLTNIQTVIAHTQKTLEPINIIAFLAALAGLGVVVLGVVEADKPLEHIGLVIAAIAGVVTVGTLAGIIILPFVPWLLLAVGVIGLAALGWWIYVRFFRKTVVAKPAA
jgi:hypothetical protein